MDSGHVHISRSNAKLGAFIPSVNLPPVLTCRDDAPCCKECYARKGRFAFARNKSRLQQNLDLWDNDPALYEREVSVAAWHAKFFRWHSAGDIPDYLYLVMMVRVARTMPGTSFLCFTKKYEYVNTFIEFEGALPPNLNIVFSAWGDFIPENPHNLPVAFVRLKDQQSPIPETAFECKRYCGDCVMTSTNCWSMKPGEAVVFDQH